MKSIELFKELNGNFAEDKDAAARIRSEIILPALEQGQHVVLNFSGVTLATQSFVHALISKALRQYGEKALQMISFEGCQPLIKGIVETVVQYVLEAEEADEQRS